MLLPRLMLWLIAGIISIAITLLAFCPASWLSHVVEDKSAGRLALGDPQGTIWHGSAFIGGAPSGKGLVTPLLPGRFVWHLSPAVLLGQVDAEISNPDALSQAITIKGDWTQWQVSPATIKLPAERLVGLGAPLNTVQPSGEIRLTWSPLQLLRQGQVIGLNGLMTLDMLDMASRLSPIKPLGAYRLLFDWHGQQAQLTLKTIKGPMLLSGSGTLNNGRLQFSGKADAEAGQETRLANLLNLLGQRRREGGRDVIALEFRQ
jgi:general secretion pathway protein N